LCPKLKKQGDADMTLAGKYSIIEQIYGTSYATAIRESQVIYPLLQCGHIIGIGMFVGAVMLVNLRIAGAGLTINLVDFSRHAMRGAWIGLLLILGSGLPMAGSYITVFAVNPVMGLKLTLVMAAICNALIIYCATAGADARWLRDPPDPAHARKWAALGISVLLTIISLGKLLAYIGGKD
jgi:hypothetical protein